ncbi:MAG: hypothetical protein ACXU9A_22575, partial [Xanthobacteraceae bacterium]
MTFGGWRNRATVGRSHFAPCLAAVTWIAAPLYPMLRFSNLGSFGQNGPHTRQMVLATKNPA